VDECEFIKKAGTAGDETQRGAGREGESEWGGNAAIRYIVLRRPEPCRLFAQSEQFWTTPLPKKLASDRTAFARKVAKESGI